MFPLMFVLIRSSAPRGSAANKSLIEFCNFNWCSFALTVSFTFVCAHFNISFLSVATGQAVRLEADLQVRRFKCEMSTFAGQCAVALSRALRTSLACCVRGIVRLLFGMEKTLMDFVIGRISSVCVSLYVYTHLTTHVSLRSSSLFISFCFSRTLNLSLSSSA